MDKRILILTTGGTLASVASETGLKPGIRKEDILDELAAVSKGIELIAEDFSSVDSANFSPKHWAALAERISHARREYSGIVVIHGTDTLAYTSSMLSFMLLNIDIPVVITGSQLNLTHPVADALENCRLAFHMAASGCPGVFVAFNRRIILGCRASKVRSLSFDAFESINFPQIGTVSSLGLSIDRNLLPERKDIFSLRNTYCDKVRVIKLFPGITSEVFEEAKQAGCRGIYVEAFGLGGIPFLGEDISAKIHELVTDGITVLVGTQCRYEGSNLNVYETGMKAKEAGVTESFDMTAEAAVTKLMWVLGQTEDPELVREYFAVSLCREVTIA